jgi:hypothetical protein
MRQFPRLLRAARVGFGLVLLAGLVLAVSHGSSSSSAPKLAPTVGQTPSSSVATQTTPSATDKAAPRPNGPAAFSRNGSTEHGDTVHLEGRFGPLLPASESDVDQTALQGCPDAGDGRELVRRLDIAVTITSSLPGEVRIGGFVVPTGLAEQYEHIHILDFVLDGPEGPHCYRGTQESEGAVDLGTLQPTVPGTLTVWVVLPDAITPNDPQPSAAQLSQEEWDMRDPAVSVDGAVASTGGAVLSVTE